MSDQDPSRSESSEVTRIFQQLQEPLRLYQEQLLRVWEPIMRYQQQVLDAYQPLLQLWPGTAAELGKLASEGQAAELGQEIERLYEPLRSQVELFEAGLRDAERLQVKLEETFAPLRRQLERFQDRVVEGFEGQLSQLESRLRDAGRLQDEIGQALEPMREQMQQFESTLERSLDAQLARLREAVDALYEPLVGQMERLHSRLESAAQEQAGGAAAEEQAGGPAAEAAAVPGADAGEEYESRLEDMTKQQLAQLAQQRGVQGRTQMSKAELIEALRAG